MPESEIQQLRKEINDLQSVLNEIKKKLYEDDNSIMTRITRLETEKQNSWKIATFAVSVISIIMYAAIRFVS